MAELKITAPKLGDKFNKILGPVGFLVESIMYEWAYKNVEGYSGGMWENVESDDGAFYRRLSDEPGPFKVSNPGNYSVNEMSTDSMGMVATLVGMNIALWEVYESNPGMGKILHDAYYKLRAFALDSEEAVAIASAID